MTEDRLLTTEEAAAYLRLSPTTLNTARYRKSIAPQLPFIRLGPGAIRYRESDLAAYVEKCAVQPDATD